MEDNKDHNPEAAGPSAHATANARATPSPPPPAVASKKQSQADLAPRPPTENPVSKQPSHVEVAASSGHASAPTGSSGNEAVASPNAPSPAPKPVSRATSVKAAEATPQQPKPVSGAANLVKSKAGSSANLQKEVADASLQKEGSQANVVGNKPPSLAASKNGSQANLVAAATSSKPISKVASRTDVVKKVDANAKPDEGAAHTDLHAHAPTVPNKAPSQPVSNRASRAASVKAKPADQSAPGAGNTEAVAAAVPTASNATKPATRAASIKAAEANPPLQPRPASKQNSAADLVKSKAGSSANMVKDAKDASLEKTISQANPDKPSTIAASKKGSQANLVGGPASKPISKAASSAEVMNSETDAIHIAAAAVTPKSATKPASRAASVKLDQEITPPQPETVSKQNATELAKSKAGSSANLVKDATMQKTDNHAKTVANKPPSNTASKKGSQANLVATASKPISKGASSTEVVKSADSDAKPTNGAANEDACGTAPAGAAVASSKAPTQSHTKQASRVASIKATPADLRTPDTETNEQAFGDAGEIADADAYYGDDGDAENHRVLRTQQSDVGSILSEDQTELVNQLREVIMATIEAPPADEPMGPEEWAADLIKSDDGYSEDLNNPDAGATTGFADQGFEIDPNDYLEYDDLPMWEAGQTPTGLADMITELVADQIEAAKEEVEDEVAGGADGYEAEFEQAPVSHQYSEEFEDDATAAYGDDFENEAEEAYYAIMQTALESMSLEDEPAAAIMDMKDELAVDRPTISELLLDRVNSEKSLPDDIVKPIKNEKSIAKDDVPIKSQINYFGIVASLRSEISNLRSEIGMRDDALEALVKHEDDLRAVVVEAKTNNKEAINRNTRILLDRQKKAYQILVAKLRREVRRLKFQRNSLSDPLIEAKYFPYLPRTPFSTTSRKPPLGIIGNLPQRSYDFFALNPPPATGNHSESGNRWWWGSGPDLSSHLPPESYLKNGIRKNRSLRPATEPALPSSSSDQQQPEPPRSAKSAKEHLPMKHGMRPSPPAFPTKASSARPAERPRKLEANGEPRIGDRAMVLINGDRCSGIVKYIGIFDPNPESGLWCGMKLDKPLGKHNGIVRGKRYFSCEENHGLFVRIEKIIPIGHAGGKGSSSVKRGQPSGTHRPISV